MRGIFEIAEVAAILRPEIGVRSNVEGVCPGVRRQEGESVRKALLDPRLQRVVIRGGLRPAVAGLTGAPS